MEYDLPTGLFILDSNSNIGEKAIDGLFDISEKLCRNIDIYTNIQRKNNDSSFVNFIQEINNSYDYIFIADKINRAKNYFSEYEGNGKWLGFMSAYINTPLIFNDVINNKQNIFKYGYKAYMCPNAKVSAFGASQAVLYTEKAICNFIVCNEWSNVWREIFRACGFYSTKFFLEQKEMVE